MRMIDGTTKNIAFPNKEDLKRWENLWGKQKFSEAVRRGLALLEEDES